MKKPLVLFLLLTFGISWGLDGLVIAGKLAQQSVILLNMWAPGVAAIITSFIFRRSVKELGLALQKPSYLIAAHFIPLLYAVPVYFGIWFFGFARFNPVFESSLLAFFTLGQLQAIIAATGQEIGWRGFLYPELNKRNSKFGAAFLTGATWTLTQLPLVAYNLPQGPPQWYALSCFTLMTISISFILAWLKDKSGSIWPTILMHAAHIFYIRGLLNHLTHPSPYRDYMSGEYGLGLALSTFVLASMLWLKHERRPAETKQIFAFQNFTI